MIKGDTPYWDNFPGTGGSSTKNLKTIYLYNGLVTIFERFKVRAIFNFQALIKKHCHNVLCMVFFDKKDEFSKHNYTMFLQYIIFG